jgi:RNA polymerase sigma factor (sigma-70 family)
LSPAKLIKKCLEGDEGAWCELVDYITPLILTLCRKNALSREESCDVFGQVSYKLLKNLRNIKSDGKLLQYVRAITTNEIINIYRRSMIEQKATTRVYDALYSLKPLTPEEIYDYSKRVELLMGALARLPQREYKLLQALFFEQHESSYKDIAERLKMPISSIGPTRARSLQKLYKYLEEEDGQI